MEIEKRHIYLLLIHCLINQLISFSVSTKIKETSMFFYSLGPPQLALLTVWVEMSLVDWVLIWIVFRWIQMGCIS